jgi:pimeloyl-ACP methyl ester carboxylesterase
MRRLALSVALTLVGILPAAGLTAQSLMASGQSTQPAGVSREFVRLGPGVPAVLYAPGAPSDRSRIGILVMHSNADYLEFSACTELARRGFRVLCANNSLSKGATFQEGQLDTIVGEVKLGVQFLRKLPGLTTVVLLGHSGGATLMSAYQMIAERGLVSCRGPEKIYQCSDSLAGLPRADGLMLIDSNWGQATMMLLSTDPAVTSEATGKAVDPYYDLFNPANGYAPTGATYPETFATRFQKAQGKRVNRLILSASQRLRDLEAGHGAFADDEPLAIPGASLLGVNNKLFPQDTRLLSRTRSAWPLLKADGTTSREVIRTVRAPRNKASLTPTLRGALNTTVRGFLSTYAIRTTADYGYGADGLRGIDWNSTYAATPSNVPKVSVPLLTMGMTGGWEFQAAELIHERSGSQDKTIAFVEGADHSYRPCEQCVSPASKYGDTIARTYEYIAQWLVRPSRFER